MRTLTLCLLIAAPALAKGVETAKIFTDKGSTYFRTDAKKVLNVGDELVAIADPKNPDGPSGRAVIMELTGSLARVSLDDDATRIKAKHVILPGNAAPAAAAPEEAAKAPAAPSGPTLDGKLELSGLRFAWKSFSDSSWTDCKLVHSDGSFFEVGEVVKHSEDGVLRVKLGGAPEPAYDHLAVICSEGESKFYFDKPSAPQGKLKGYAVNNGGSVVVYNQNDTAWTACDVRKPNGTHYVLGTLKGHQDDSIDKGRFKKEEDNKPKWIEMRCKEGQLRTAL